jgi:addiction module HigA family antidote
MIEFMLPLGLSVETVAERLCVAKAEVTAIIEGASSVTPEMAFRLGRAFSTFPHFWLNLEHLQHVPRGELAAILEVNLPNELVNKIEETVVPFQERIFISH